MWGSTSLRPLGIGLAGTDETSSLRLSVWVSAKQRVKGLIFYLGIKTSIHLKYITIITLFLILIHNAFGEFKLLFSICIITIMIIIVLYNTYLYYNFIR